MGHLGTRPSLGAGGEWKVPKVKEMVSWGAWPMRPALSPKQPAPASQGVNFSENVIYKEGREKPPSPLRRILIWVWH